LGPNGAGKTTTISVLTTTLSKTSGTVKINGYDIDKEASQVRAKIGVIFQKPSLDLNLTAEENIRLHCVLYKMYNFQPSYAMMPKSYKDKVAQLAEILDIKGDIFKPIKTFSGGMKRKLEIVRTLMHQPKVLFLDEPTSGLDPLSRKNLWEYLKDIRKKENTTIFLTTHYLEEAEDADTVCVINHGKIIVNSTVDDIKNKLVKHHIYVEANNKNDLKSELVSLNYKFEESGSGYNIFSQKEDSQKINKSINTTLTKLNIHQPTLEDVYLDLIKGNDD
jgi:ABC-2 type transport system ATP-binding protein